MINTIFYQIFLLNKYSKWYFNIIQKAKQETRLKSNEYYEFHHIIPKSIKPEYNKEPWNKVLLTPKEHFICHLLLTKMLKGKDKNKMIYALWTMCNQKNKYQQRFSSKLYSHYRHIMKDALVSDRKGKTLEELYGKEKADKIKEHMKNRLPRSSVSDEEKLKISERMKTLHQERPWKRHMQTVGKLPTGTCKYCNKIMDVGNLGKYHNEKCKLREISE